MLVHPHHTDCLVTPQSLMLVGEAWTTEVVPRVDRYYAPTAPGLAVVRGPGVDEGGGPRGAPGACVCHAVRPGRGRLGPLRAWRRIALPGGVRGGSAPGRWAPGGTPARGGPRDRGGPVAVWPRGGPCARCHDTPRTGRRPRDSPRTSGRSWPTVQEPSTSTT
jgi:hypothetical protein